MNAIKDIFLGPDEFYPVDFKKTIIYLHHTCGSCFVGETLIDLVNGDKMRIDEFEKGKEYYIYGCDENGDTKIVKCIGLGETKRVNKIVEITLDNGNVERCTLNHEWMMRDGTYKKASELNRNDSLMPLYKRLDSRGYEEVKNNLDDKWYKTHQLSGKIKYGENMYKNKEKMVLHHIDFNKLNNNPDNLYLMEKNEHILFHSKIMIDKWRYKMKLVSSSNMKKLMKKQINDENYLNKISEALKKRWKNGEHKKKVSKAVSERNKQYAIYKKSEISYKEWKETYNHKITKISFIELEKELPVYDLYSPETHNFALSSGVFVHNSRPDWVVQGWDTDKNEDGTVRKIATAFVIGGKSTRDGDATWDGTVVRCFPESQWAFHLGVKGTNGLFDKISIGIEICNYGYLTLSKSGQFMTYVNTPVPQDQVVELPRPFRGFKYYHKYTDKQLDSLRQLLIFLANKYGINLKLGLLEWLNKETLIMPNGLSILDQQRWLNQHGFVGKNGKPLVEDGAWGANSAWAVQSLGKSAFEFNPLTLNGYPGIWSHSNSRPDKTDISPQPNLIAMLKSL